MSNTANTWQPIETAPKNTPVLAAWSRGAREPTPLVELAICVFLELNEGFFAWFYSSDGYLAESDMVPVDPTHWMPLPDAPD